METWKMKAKNFASGIIPHKSHIFSLCKTSFGITAVLMFLGVFTCMSVSDHLYKLYGHLDKKLHFFVYAVLWIFITWLVNNRRRIFSRKKLKLPLISGCVLGITTEALQKFVPRRSVQASDAVANIAGAIFGIILFMIIVQAVKFFKTRKTRNISTFLQEIPSTPV